MAAKTAFDRFVGSVSSGRNWRYRPTLMVAYSVRFIFIGLIFVATYREPGGTKRQQKNNITEGEIIANSSPLAKPLMNEETEQQDNMNTYI